jgi:hypothetical protein
MFEDISGNKNLISEYEKYCEENRLDHIGIKSNLLENYI